MHSTTIRHIKYCILMTMFFIFIRMFVYSHGAFWVLFGSICISIHLAFDLLNSGYFSQCIDPLLLWLIPTALSHWFWLELCSNSLPWHCTLQARWICSQLSCPPPPLTTSYLRLRIQILLSRCRHLGTHPNTISTSLRTAATTEHFMFPRRLHQKATS